MEFGSGGIQVHLLVDMAHTFAKTKALGIAWLYWCTVLRKGRRCCTPRVLLIVTSLGLLGALFSMSQVPVLFPCIVDTIKYCMQLVLLLIDGRAMDFKLYK